MVEYKYEMLRYKYEIVGYKYHSSLNANTYR